MASLSLVGIVSTLVFYQIALAATQAQWPSTASPSDIVISNTVPNENTQFVTQASDGDYIVTYLLNGRAYAQKFSAADGSAVAAWNGGSATIAGVGTPAGIIPDASGGAYVAWNNDLGGGNCDVFVQRLSSAGATQYGFGGLNVTTGSGCESFQQMIPDGAGGFYIAWGNGGATTTPSQARDLYITQVDSSGTVNTNWNTGGAGTFRPVQFPETVAATSFENSAQIVDDGTGNIVAMYESSDVSFYFAATKFSSTGTIAGAPWNTPLQIDANSNGNLGRHLLSDGSGNVYVGFLVGPFGSPTSIEAQKIDSSGSLQWGAGVTVSSTNITGFDGHPRIVYDGGGGVIIAWHTAGGANDDAYAHHVTSAGALDSANNWAAAPIALSDTTDGNTSWFLNNNREGAESDGAGGAYFLYGTFEGGAYAVSKLQHIDSTGAVEFSGDGTNLGIGAGITGVQAVMTSDGSTGVVTIFQDEGPSGLDLYGQYFDEFISSQTQTGTLPVTCSPTAPSFSVTPAAAFNFYLDGSSGTIYSSSSQQTAFNNPNGAGLGNAAGEDYIQIRDVRDPSDPGCNDGLNLTVAVRDGTDGDNIYFDDNPSGAGGNFIPLENLMVVSSNDNCPAGTTATANGVCFDDNALCGDGDNNPAIACASTDGSTSVNYDGNQFGDFTTFAGNGAVFGLTNTPNVTPTSVIAFSDGDELFGDAGVATTYGMIISAGQPSGSYIVEIEYTLTGF